MRGRAYAVIPVEHLRVEYLDVGVSLPPSALLALDLPGDDDIRLLVHLPDGSGQPASLVLSPEYSPAATLMSVPARHVLWAIRLRMATGIRAGDSRGDLRAIRTVRHGRPPDVVVERLAAFVTP
jgi:hypothetical protein